MSGDSEWAKAEWRMIASHSAFRIPSFPIRQPISYNLGVNRDRPENPPMPASKPAAERRSRILIADDNQPNVELMEAFLADVDCDVAVAVDGRDTLEKVGTFQPDLILLDVMMPKLSGFEVCKKIKSDPKTKGTMVLMVTALNERGDIERGVDSGTDDFLSKPVNKVELVKRVENMLKLRHVTDELERLRRYIQELEDDSGPRE
jgi:two-component system alkaline phosphatase synthesis response regulator PhoP